MKFYIVAAVLSVAIAATLIASTNANNSTWGAVGPFDMILYRQNVVKKAHWIRVETEDVVFPLKHHLNYHRITCIKAIDRDHRNGGFATLYKGGPGYYNTTIHLKSQRNYGLNFTVEIYGR